MKTFQEWWYTVGYKLDPINFEDVWNACQSGIEELQLEINKLKLELKDKCKTCGLAVSHMPISESIPGSLTITHDVSMAVWNGEKWVEEK